MKGIGMFNCYNNFFKYVEMLRSFNGLTQQLFENKFRNMLFSIYNFIEEEYYINSIKSLGYDGDIDSLEFMILDTNGVSHEELLLFRHYIEDEIQKGRVIVSIMFYPCKKGTISIVIKPKSVNIEDIIKKS